MSYGYGGYGYPPGQAPQRPGYGYPPGQTPPRGAFPPGQPAGYAPAPQFPPGQPPPAGYQGYAAQQPPAYGMPGYGPSQPQGYTPVVTSGYQPTVSRGPPNIANRPPTAQQQPPQRYAQPSRPAPGPPAPGPALGPPAQGVSVPHSFPEIRSMSKEELGKLVDNDAALVDYFESREDIKRLQEARKAVVSRNEELATQNLSLKPQLEEKQQELIELYSELEAQRTELSDLQQQQQALADHYAPHNILARLKIAASEVEDESDAISENFLNGDISIDEFLKTYIPKKTLCHSRRAKEEKMERMGI